MGRVYESRELEVQGRRVLRRGIWVWQIDKPADEPDSPKDKRPPADPKCIDCGESCSRGAKRCKECFSRSRRKAPRRRLAIERPRRYGGELLPHGTHAAFMRHRNAGEEACEECVRGERLYQKHAKRRRRDEIRAREENEARKAVDAA